MASCKIDIFFEIHEFTEAIKVLIKLLPSYKERGYSILALEEIESKNVNNIRDFYKTFARSKSDWFYYNALLIKEAQKLGFEIIPVDIEESRYSELSDSYDAMEASYHKGIMSGPDLINHIKSPKAHKQYIESVNHPFVVERDEHFVLRIDDVCDKNKTGILGLFGHFHSKITAALKHKGHQAKGFYINDDNHFLEESGYGKARINELFELINPDFIQKHRYPCVAFLQADKRSIKDLVEEVKSFENQELCILGNQEEF